VNAPGALLLGAAGLFGGRREISGWSSCLGWRRAGPNRLGRPDADHPRAMKVIVPWVNICECHRVAQSDLNPNDHAAPVGVPGRTRDGGLVSAATAALTMCRSRWSPNYLAANKTRRKWSTTQSEVCRYQRFQQAGCVNTEASARHCLKANPYLRNADVNGPQRFDRRRSPPWRIGRQANIVRLADGCLATAVRR
jgi:hypothetical protein